MSPGSKRKVKHRAANDRAKRGINIKFRRELGINISSSTLKDNENVTELQQAMIDFFNRDDVSRVCPDTKKMLKNLVNDEKFLSDTDVHAYPHCMRNHVKKSQLITMKIRYASTQCTSGRRKGETHGLQLAIAQIIKSGQSSRVWSRYLMISSRKERRQ